MLAFGQVCDIDGVAGKVKVYLPDSGVTTEWIPVLRSVASGTISVSIPVGINDLVVVGRTNTDYWFVVAASVNDFDKPYTGASADKMGVKFADGCLIEYDISTKKLTVSTTGEVDVTAAKVNITATEVNITGAVNVTGALTVSGALNAAGGLSATAVDGDAGIDFTGDVHVSGDVKSGNISLSGHKHTGVTIGGGVTGGPFVEV